MAAAHSKPLTEMKGWLSVPKKHVPTESKRELAPSVRCKTMQLSASPKGCQGTGGHFSFFHQELIIIHITGSMDGVRLA